MFGFVFDCCCDGVKIGCGGGFWMFVMMFDECYIECLVCYVGLCFEVI